MGSNPGAVYCMDMTFFTLVCCENCIVCLEGLKINEKEAGVGPFKKEEDANQGLVQIDVTVRGSRAGII